MKSRLATLFVLISFLSSCSYQEIMDEKMFVDSLDVISEFHASFSETEAGVDSLETRTYIEEDSQSSRLNLYWNEDDRISVFCGNTLNQQYRFDGETGDNSGTFKLIAADENVSYNPLDTPTNIAYYPYDENTEISEDGALVVNFPETQYYAENSFGPDANAMVAVTENPDDLDLKFKNVGGYLRFRFYGDDITIKSVVLKGNNGEKLSGKAIINCGYDMVPDLVMDNEAAEELTLRCNGGIKIGTTNESATEFWFVLPPVKFSKGFTITVTDINDGIFTKTTEKVFEVRRNTIKPVSAVKVETVVDWEAIYARERAALLEFYEATGGDNWTDNTNWCSDLPIKDWKGIFINKHGRIETLKLNNNNLVGQIPEIIGSLTALYRLDLTGNQLSGSIPESIGNLTNLGYHLGLNYNKLTGSIPESIGNLIKLENLYLNDNKLTGIIPESIGNLTNLEKIDLSSNQLSGSIPESISNLDNLSAILLDDNQLSGSIPESIGSLSHLRNLNLGDNQLSGSIPKSIGNLVNSAFIYLDNNKLSGSIPESIGNPTNLKDLFLNGNQLSGSIPESIGNLSNLERIDLSKNQLSGSIPESIANLSNLKELWIIGGNNKFSGVIPENIGNLVNLKFLDLHGQKLTGSIPESIGNLVNLTSLRLDDNQLSGNIPESIGNLVNLSELRLYYNQLTGSIPESICNLTKLPSLSLDGNQLSGSIPQNIGNLTNLKDLSFGDNIGGSIPESIGNLVNLTALNLGGKQLNGSIPESIGNMKSLTSLTISGTQISGTIPESIGNLVNLTSLHLSENKLSGSIPESIGSLANLTYLNLRDNQLSGSIPESIGELHSLESLVLMGNQLNSIPESLANLPSLTFLNLKGNQFSTIPASLQSSNVWKDFWWMVLPGNPYLNKDELIIPGPDFNLVDIYGETISSENEYSKNKLTVLYLWATWCGFSMDFNKTLNALYEEYRDKGFEIIGQANGDISRYFVVSNDIRWKNFKPVHATNQLIFKGADSFPNVIVVDNNKKVVFDSYTQHRSKLVSFVQNYFASSSEDDMYTSTDYSRDGEVVILQQATLGRGVDLTFLGEGFVDKDMESGGHYEQKMREAMEKLFSMEPYKSMRNRFNVYAVKVVSPNAEFINPNAKHRINDDRGVCFEYAQKILPYSNNNAPMVTVVYNVDYPYGRSNCISYYEDEESFVAFIREGISNAILHETGGHGIAKLMDEYVETGNESSSLPDEERIALDNIWSQYGRGANVDWRNDASTVKWALFLSDERYSNEGLGLYEGSVLYGRGAYRPSENSMMRYSDSPFNAPSREQIYKRVMQLSEGSDWVYDYEEFVAFDAPNRTAASAPATKSASVESRNEHMRNHQPPTIIEGSWRDELKGR